MLLKDLSHSEKIILFIFSSRNIPPTLLLLQPSHEHEPEIPEQKREKKRERKNAIMMMLNGILYPFEICEMLCTCGLLHCKASHYHHRRHLFGGSKQDRIIVRHLSGLFSYCGLGT